MVLNPGLLDWESSVLITKLLLQLQIQRLYIQTLIICLAKLWDPTSFQGFRGPLQWLTSIREDCLPTYEVTNVGLGKTKSFHENFFNIKLFQLTKYQDQNLTLSDIDGQEKKKERKSELQKFDNLEDKRILFILIAKIKIVDTIFNSCNKIWYIKSLMHTYFLPEIHYPHLLP